ncbi:unnamed protein product [Orchesella dallaii]|uniref:Poly [ADP-ribose] polymerase n=1 Tax=Orchesella dallaii TaxID=48710 RepID=A0ABP1PUR3_9HEXA
MTCPCTSWRIASILQHGFQTPTFYDGYGQGFGRGFYFSDRIIKCRRMSSSHNGQSHKNDVGYLLLCDVLLGNQCTARRLPRQYRRPPPGRNSIVALGYNAPNPDEDVRYNGSTIPLGITERRTFRNGGYDIQYNKYVSYSSEYVKPRYIIKVQYASN